MILRSEANILRERVSTFLGTLLLGSVALWAGITIWETANGQNPLVHAFTALIERDINGTY